MSSHHAIQAVTEAGAALTRVEFENLLEIESFYRELSAAFQAAATGIRAHGDRRGSEDPLHPDVVATIQESAQGLEIVAQYIGGVPSLLRQLQAEDFRRIEDPRNGEHKADHSRNNGS